MLLYRFPLAFCGFISFVFFYVVTITTSNLQNAVYIPVIT